MSNNEYDVVLVGAGAMSTCLAMLLKQLDPSLKIMMIERLETVARESTASLNNAGTGHAAYCELNYTPQAEDGSVSIDKALEINEAFEISLQFWSYCVEQGLLPEPEEFINPIPHQSFVWGEDNVEFLRKRHEMMSAHPMFAQMKFTDDPDVIREWFPLIMQGRDPDEKVAATKISHGTDVNFAQIAHNFVRSLRDEEGFELRLNINVTDLKKQSDGRWEVKIEDKNLEKKKSIFGKFVFLGGGGGALPLLQMADIPESNGYGGFPVSGQWLVCRNPNIVKQHSAKVYGKAELGAPPMSVPHLDTRVLEDGKALLFGPFAGFTTKFLKHGSKFDLLKSASFSNVMPISMVGFRNFDLTKYLIGESRKSHKDRIKSLQRFYPDADPNDWVFAIAGQRVQIIKKCDDKGGKLEFGTEVVSAADGTLSALLGASPGASVTVKAMLEVIESCFGDQLATPEWQAKIKEMVPSYKQSLKDNPELLKEVRTRTLKTLELGSLD